MSLRLCLIGHPVEHSLSPPLHRAALKYLGLEGSYELVDLEADALASFVKQSAERGLSGFNVTIPYKENVFGLVKGSPEAELLCAVNTVRIDSSGILHGHNTDLAGFVKAIQNFCGEDFPFQNCNALLLGAGGAARACIAGLFLLGAKEMHVAARGVTRIEQVGKDLSARLSTYLERDCPISVLRFTELPELVSTMPFSLMVNCTPLGLQHDDETPDWANAIFQDNGSAVFFDIVYKRDRSPTLLMQLASSHRLKVSDGLSMLVEQAAFAFEFWSGRKIDSKYMYNAIASGSV